MSRIHVLTVHWQDPRWIAPQVRYLDRNLDDYRVYAAVNGIDLALAGRFHYAEDLDGSHPEKLNLLAEIARADARPDDLLLFLDGDAFPIAPVGAGVLAGLPLAAVRRDENLGQQQPHPCFCLTTVGFWFDIGGDWRRGYTWTASNGEEVTDAGGNLLGILRARNVEWRPLLRSNRVDLHPLWFGVYADLVYHHGAGFRAPVSLREARPAREAVRAAVSAARIPPRVPVLGRLERSIRYRIADRRAVRAVERAASESEALSEEVFCAIEQDPEFYRRFTG
jgi:hypothetical protein